MFAVVSVSHKVFTVIHINIYIRPSAVKRLIAFIIKVCVYIICVYCVYLLNTHMHLYILKVFTFILSVYIYIYYK